jgi:hypothetical protein
MPYSAPTLNITCNIFSNGAGPPNPPRLANVACQLRAPGKSSSGQDAQSLGWVFLWSLCLSAGTDIRDPYSIALGDTVEVPAGSGRFYDVMIADDVAKGFANEYRIAMLRKRAGWPTPIP